MEMKAFLVGALCGLLLLAVIGVLILEDIKYTLKALLKEQEALLKEQRAAQRRRAGSPAS
jgi:hypothetical protein